MSEPHRPQTAVIGAGRLARALLPPLASAGYPIVAVASRRLGAARSACRLIGRGRATTVPARAARDARLILLAVPDREIDGIAAQLAGAALAGWSRRTVLHHAGARGLEPLRPIARAGGSVGLIHPLQCLGRTSRASRLLAGSRARIEGDARGQRVARRLARDLGLVPLRFSSAPTPNRRAAYHAAASLLSNDLLALLSYGLQLMRDAGLGEAEALRALLPLARGTLGLAEREGLGAALTGPAVRGDAPTIEAHLARLRRISPKAAEVHRLLSAHLRELAGRPPRSSSRRRRQPAGRARGATV